MPLRDFPLAHGPFRRTAKLSVPLELRSSADFRLAGAPMADGTVGEHFDGKIESPTLRDDPAGAGAVIAAWDFSRDMASTRAIDTGPRLQHGTLVNLPARAMKGGAGPETSMTGASARSIMAPSISTTTTSTMPAGRPPVRSPSRAT